MILLMSKASFVLENYEEFLFWQKQRTTGAKPISKSSYNGRLSSIDEAAFYLEIALKH